MDDLDRLAFRVARTVRTTYPHLLERGFTLSDLEERLAPYPEARREMAHGGPDGYEQTVLRLLAGERGYLAAEPELQEACRRALQMASPAVSIVRSWAGSTLSLRGAAFTLGSERTTVHATRALPPTHGRAQRAVNVVELVDASDSRNPTSNPEASHQAELCTCHFCGGALPSNRSITYCPFCGIDLTVRHCPACSTELKRDWRFCVTCGRQADDGVEELEASRESTLRSTVSMSSGAPMLPQTVRELPRAT